MLGKCYESRQTVGLLASLFSFSLHLGSSPLSFHLQEFEKRCNHIDVTNIALGYAVYS